MRNELRFIQIGLIEWLASAAVSIWRLISRARIRVIIFGDGGKNARKLNAHRCRMRINHSVWHCKWHGEGTRHWSHTKPKTHTKNIKMRCHLTIKSISISLTSEELTSSRSIASMGWCILRCPRNYKVQFWASLPEIRKVKTKRRNTTTDQLSVWRETKQSRKMQWLLVLLPLPLPPLLLLLLHVYRRWHRSRVAFELFTVQRAICHRILDFMIFHTKNKSNRIQTTVFRWCGVLLCGCGRRSQWPNR